MKEKCKLPHIFLIILDCGRQDRLSCYSYKKHTSPNIDKIAEEATIYKNAISVSPWTLPSHASIFTGTYVSTHKTDLGNERLNESFITIAEALREFGYYTIGISSNVWISQRTNLNKGFTFFKNVNVPPFFEKKPPSFLKKFLNICHNFYWNYYYGKKYDKGAHHANRLLKKIILKTYKEKPLFVFVNYLECHLPYKPPLQFRYQFIEPNYKHLTNKVNQDAYAYMAGKVAMGELDFMILNALYDAEIKYLDHKVGELFDFIKNLNIIDNTIFIITSDHGENIGEHGLMDHQFSVHNTLLKIPLIIRYPSLSPKATYVDQYVQSIDLFKTLVEVLNIKNSYLSEQLQGKVLLPECLKNNENIAYAEYLVPATHLIKKRFPDVDLSQFSSTYRAIFLDQYKYISSDKENRLYDLTNDPYEKKDIISHNPEITTMMKTKINEIRKSLTLNEKPRNEEKYALDGEIKKALENLGYF